MRDPRGPGRLLGIDTCYGMTIHGAHADLEGLVEDWGVVDIVAAMHDILLNEVDNANLSTDGEDDTDITRCEKRVEILARAYKSLEALEY